MAIVIRRSTMVWREWNLWGSKGLWLSCPLSSVSIIFVCFVLFCFVVYWWKAVNDKRLRAIIWNGDQQSLWCVAMRLKAADFRGCWVSRKSKRRRRLVRSWGPLLFPADYLLLGTCWLLTTDQAVPYPNELQLYWTIPHFTLLLPMPMLRTDAGSGVPFM